MSPYDKIDTVPHKTFESVTVKSGFLIDFFVKMRKQ